MKTHHQLLLLSFLCCFCAYCVQHGASQFTLPPVTQTCKHIDDTVIPYCNRFNIEYNTTSYPTLNNIENQAQAHVQISNFNQLILTNCSGAVLVFLCSYYTPFCTTVEDSQGTVTRYRLSPCQSLCQEVYNNCIGQFQENNLEWPQQLNCNNFPTSFCFKPDNISSLVLPAIIPGVNGPIPSVVDVQPSPSSTEMTNIPSSTDNNQDIANTITNSSSVPPSSSAPPSGNTDDGVDTTTTSSTTSTATILSTSSIPPVISTPIPTTSIGPSTPSITLNYNLTTLKLTCTANYSNGYQWTDLSTGNVVSNDSIFYTTIIGSNKRDYQCTAYNEFGNNTAVIKGCNPTICAAKDLYLICQAYTWRNFSLPLQCTQFH